MLIWRSGEGCRKTCMRIGRRRAVDLAARPRQGPIEPAARPRQGPIEPAARLPPGARVESSVEGSEHEKGFRERMTRQGEEAIGKLAQELLENPMVTGALSAALQTREKAMHAQEAALSAFNLPSAGDLERLTRRLRSVSQRLEGIEDVLDRLERGVQELDGGPVERRLAGIERAVERIEAQLAELAAAGESSERAGAASSSR
jgi:hypothetical protein